MVICKEGGVKNGKKNEVKGSTEGRGRKMLEGGAAGEGE